MISNKKRTRGRGLGHPNSKLILDLFFSLMLAILASDRGYYCWSSVQTVLYQRHFEKEEKIKQAIFWINPINSPPFYGKKPPTLLPLLLGNHETCMNSDARERIDWMYINFLEG